MPAPQSLSDPTATLTPISAQIALEAILARSTAILIVKSRSKQQIFVSNPTPKNPMISATYSLVI
jgi:hypothetical protein